MLSRSQIGKKGDRMADVWRDLQMGIQKKLTIFEKASQEKSKSESQTKD